MIIKNLIRDYDGFKLQIPEWVLPDHGISALSGSSGSGKTTVIRILLGLEPCPTLSWQFGNIDLAKLAIEKKRLAVVFQNYELFRHLSARENILFAAQARNVDSATAKARLKSLCDRLRIETILDRPATNLSGGERQRVALARALIGEPRFLFLDEPFTALDADMKTEARLLVKKTVEEFKIPTLLISHDPADLEALAQSVTKIEHGRITK